MAKARRETPCVYVIRCEPSQRCYVGQTVCGVASRWKNHLSLLRRGCHSSALMQQDWNQYGEAAFKVEILEEVTSGLDDAEWRWMTELKAVYCNDYRLAIVQAVLDTYEPETIDRLFEGALTMIETTRLQALEDRLQWLETQVAMLDRRTRKRRPTPGQIDLPLG